jgi:uncharacterized membrane protein YeaQ/YmgE (transglycosylase-associated protein family)
MNLILWLIIGGILGWLASIIMHTNAQQGIVLNIIVGIVGALLAGLLLTPLFGIGTINQSNFSWFCRKFQFWGQNPKIGYQKFNDLQTPKLSKKQICDRTVACPKLVRASFTSVRN